MLMEEVKAQKVISECDPGVEEVLSFSFCIQNLRIIEQVMGRSLFSLSVTLWWFCVQELVWILHKALEAAQLEKRTCAEFLAEKGEQERLELLRHRERQAADLRSRLEEAKVEAEALRSSLAQRDAQVAELQENIKMLTEKNNAKQEVSSHDG